MLGRAAGQKNTRRGKIGYWYIHNAVGDSSTPTVSHVDVLGLGMSVSGAILARGSEA